MSVEKTDAPKAQPGLKIGTSISGTVKSLNLSGAMVDIGNGHEALLHISQLGRSDVRNIEDVLTSGDTIDAFVLKVNKAGNVALTMVKPPALPWETLAVGDSYSGEVTRIEKFGVFVDIGAERPGMVHVSEMTDGFVQSPGDLVKEGETVQVRVLKVNRRNRQIDLSMKESIPEIEDVIEEEGEVLTAMEAAFRRAQSTTDDTVEEQAKRSKKSRRETQDDILSRTLRHHDSN